MTCMQAFSAWIHTCAVRLFTESILRYGLPPQFLGVLMKPSAKAQAKLRKSLASVFGSTGMLVSTGRPLVRTVDAFGMECSICLQSCVLAA